MRIHLHSITTKLLIISGCISVAVIIFTPSDPLPYRTSLTAENIRFINKIKIASPFFIDTTLRSRIIAQHTQGGKHLSGLNETLGSGSCAFDFDNDGWIDIFTIGGSGQTRFYGRAEWWQKSRGNSLYKNLGNGEFRDITFNSGLKTKAWGMGCTSADFDNDGDQDLLVTNLGENTFYKNNGDGTFSDITNETGLSGNNWSTSATVADYDQDGLLDIYIVNYIDYKKGAHTLENSSGFRPQTKPTFNPHMYNSQGNKLYKNNGNLKFEDVTTTAGVKNTSGRGLSAVWQDINDDSKADLIIANDAGLPNALFINNGNGKFSEKTAQYNLSTTKSTRSIAAGDIDNDGDIDIFMSTNNKTPLITYLNNSNQKNSTSNNNQKKFQNINRDLGFGDEQTTSLNKWSISLQDFNNDGWLDLLSTNGSTSPDPDNPRLPKGQPKQIWLNQTNGTFKSCNDCGVDLQISMSARGVAIADYDNDGDIDIYATHNNDIGQLLINKIKNKNWINLQLQGTTSNRDAIGSKVSIKTAKGRQVRYVDGNPTFLSSGDKRIHFGLNDVRIIDEIIIQWPNGEKVSFKDVKSNQFIFIKQDSNSYKQIKHNNRKVQPLNIAFKEPFHRASTIGWLMNSNSKELAEQELIQLYKSKNASVRYEVIKLAGLHTSPITLSILKDALKDNELTNRLAVVKNLQATEDETAVSWLLRSFNDNNSKMRCAVANTFAFFFREEEAVINHKYLAVPYLIKMLSDKYPEVRACAARALGDAELYRGAAPLAHLLTDDEIFVRAEAARALGLVREKKSIPFLLNVIKNANQTAKVKFHSLVALKRLQYPNITGLISGNLSASIKNKNHVQTYNLLLALQLLISDREDGVTIRSSIISDITHQWLTNTTFSKKTSKDLLKAQSIAVEILRKTKNNNSIKHIKKLLRSKNESVRASAYIYMLNSNKTNTNKYIATGLQDDSLKVKGKILSHITKENILPSLKVIRSMQKHPSLELLKLQSLKSHKDTKVADYLIEYTNNKNHRLNLRIAAFNSLLKQQIKNFPKLPSALYKDADKTIRASTLLYWTMQNKYKSHIKSIPGYLKDALKDNKQNVRRAAINAIAIRKEYWAAQTLFKSLLDTNEPKDLRIDILNQLSKTKSNWNTSNILRIAKNKNDILRIDAIKALSNQSNEEAEKYLITVYNDTKESEINRFNALQALITINPKIDRHKLIMSKR